MEKIQLFITGGTFDKEYKELDGSFGFRDTHINEMLSEARSELDIDFKTLMMIDSLDMTDSDRNIIFRN